METRVDEVLPWGGREPNLKRERRGCLDTRKGARGGLPLPFKEAGGGAGEQPKEGCLQPKRGDEVQPGKERTTAKRGRSKFWKHHSEYRGTAAGDR